MAFFGQNYFKDLLHYSDEHTLNDNAAIEQNYQLQRRLTDFFANNDKVQLLKSQKYSGEVNLLGDKSPLGGPIDWNLNGIRNVPNLNDNGCPPEFPFWNFKKENNENTKNSAKSQQPKKPLNAANTPKPIQQKNLVNTFNDNNSNNNNKKNNRWWIILIIVVPILIFFIIYYLSKPKPLQSEYLMSYY